MGKIKHDPGDESVALTGLTCTKTRHQNSTEAGDRWPILDNYLAPAQFPNGRLVRCHPGRARSEFASSHNRGKGELDAPVHLLGRAARCMGYTGHWHTSVHGRSLILPSKVRSAWSRSESRSVHKSLVRVMRDQVLIPWLLPQLRNQIRSSEYLGVA